MDNIITDGYSEWQKCSRTDCDLQIVRPGKVQCKGEHDELGCPPTKEDAIEKARLIMREIIRKSMNR